MKTLDRFLIRLRNLVTGQRGDHRLREELEDYVARETEAAFHVRGSFDAVWLPQVANQPAISAENRRGHFAVSF